MAISAVARSPCRGERQIAARRQTPPAGRWCLLVGGGRVVEHRRLGRACRCKQRRFMIASEGGLKLRSPIWSDDAHGRRRSSRDCLWFRSRRADLLQATRSITDVLKLSRHSVCLPFVRCCWKLRQLQAGCRSVSSILRFFPKRSARRDQQSFETTGFPF